MSATMDVGIYKASLRLLEGADTLVHALEQALTAFGWNKKV